MFTKTGEAGTDSVTATASLAVLITLALLVPLFATTTLVASVEDTIETGVVPTGMVFVTVLLSVLITLTLLHPAPELATYARVPSESTVIEVGAGAPQLGVRSIVETDKSTALMLLTVVPPEFVTHTRLLC